MSGDVDDGPTANPRDRALTLTPSDEQLISKLSFTPETELIERAPDHKAASVGTKWSERTVFNNVDIGFLSLPTEILNYLQPYLTLSSEVALRHSCSRFFHLYQSRLVDSSSLFLYLCMIERDEPDVTKMERLACGACRAIHPRIAFPSAELKQPPLQRDCRQVWLCAHKYMSYPKTIKNVRTGFEAPFRAESLEPCSRCRETIRNRSVADRPEKGTSQIDLESPKSQSLLISKIGLLQAPSPIYNIKGSSNSSGMYKEVFGVKAVSDALQAINFPICPHISLGDPPILSKFCRSCINTQKLPPGVKGPPCISEPDKKGFGEAKTVGRCRGHCFTRNCRSSWMFQSRESLTPDASGRRQIWLIIVVYRWLGPLMTIDRAKDWTAHAVKHEDRLKMKKSWTEWSKQSRQPMPNWSISLLHPDDANLR